jgi:hypothetical protein
VIAKMRAGDRSERARYDEDRERQREAYDQPASVGPQTVIEEVHEYEREQASEEEDHEEAQPRVRECAVDLAAKADHAAG